VPCGSPQVSHSRAAAEGLGQPDGAGAPDQRFLEQAAKAGYNERRTRQDRPREGDNPKVKELAQKVVDVTAR
jgi:hypothetical protein